MIVLKNSLRLEHQLIVLIMLRWRCSQDTLLDLESRTSTALLESLRESEYSTQCGQAHGNAGLLVRVFASW